MRTDRWRAHMRCVVRQALEAGSMSFEAIRERLTKIMLVTPEEDMYADVLDYLLGVFESEFGYFGYINQAGDLVCPSMTRPLRSPPSRAPRIGAGPCSPDFKFTSPNRSIPTS
jgi:hypothetical protein